MSECLRFAILSCGSVLLVLTAVRLASGKRRRLGAPLSPSGNSITKRPGIPRLRLQISRYVNGDSVIASLVLLAGVSGCLALFYYNTSRDHEQARLNFKLLAEESMSSIENRITENSTTVGAVASYFNASNRVDRGEFSVFVRPFISKNKCIQALQWVPRVLNKDRERYESAARRDGVSGFHFKEWLQPHVSTTAGIRKDYFVVYYNEPLSTNKAVTGMDNGSEPVRRRALLESAMRGSETYSPPITLIQGSASQKGYLVFLPVYDTAKAPSTPQERLKRLRGFATGAFVVDRVVKSALGQRNTESICLDIADVTDPQHSQKLDTIGSPKGGTAGMSYDRLYSFGGRRWRFHVVPGAGYAMPSQFLAWARLIFSLVLTGLVFAFLVYRSIAVRTLRASEQKHRLLLEKLHSGVVAHGPDARILFSNTEARKLLGMAEDEIAGKSIMDPACGFVRIDGSPLPVEEHPASIVLSTKKSIGDLILGINRTNTQEQVWAQVSGYPIFNTDGTVHSAVITFVDVTERKKAESQIRLHSAAINAADDLIAILGSAGQIVFANDAFQRHTGRTPQELTGQDLSVLWPQSLGRPSEQNAWEAIRAGVAWKGEMPCKSMDGSNCTTDVTITPLPDEQGRSEHLIVIARNITERKEYEVLLDYQAHHDALTGLPNRLLFSKELASAVSDHGSQNKQCAVLYIDLDQFKMVNDTMGHQVGDGLLVETAARLGLCVREGDILGRMGGDEFIILLKNLKSTDDVAVIAERILERISVPFGLDGSRLVIGASIGVSTYPDNATDANGMLKAADAAMYRAKELGRNNCQFFSDELSRANLARVEMERDLRLAIERNELKVYYQPIVDVRTMQLAGAEALLRWNHPEKGMVSPGLFVPVAEETGLIVQMGKTVLETACKQCRIWQDMGYTNFEMSVNVSPVQLRKEELPSWVLDVLVDTGLSARSLNLELTETALAKDHYGEVDILAKLKALGIKTCLDDFGIGYSSLSRLKDLPIMHMKVDGAFIREIEHSANDRAMTESIIVMAHNLGITVTAEWIENEDQMATIRALGCDYAQGYLISPALSPEDFGEFMREWTLAQRQTEAA